MCASQLRNFFFSMLNMSTLQERITLTYKNENKRRMDNGEMKLTLSNIFIFVSP